MSVLVDIVNAIIDVKDSLVSFFTDGIYNTLVEFTAYYIKAAVVAGWKWKLAMLEFSWDVAQELIESLNISTFLNSAWSSLNSQVLQMLIFFRIPEAINIILSAAATRFVFRFMGF